MRLKEINSEDRPRERLVNKGAAALSNAELTAILLRTGGCGKNAVETAHDLLRSAGSLTALSTMPIEKMTEIRGIGIDKAVMITAAFEIGRRLASEKTVKNKTPVTSATQIFELLQPLVKGLDHEVCWVVYLNRANRIIGKEQLSSGGQTCTVFDTGMIIRKALEKKALGLIVAHNHPSGSPYPGKADIQQTRMLKTAAATFGISLLDHVILCDNCYYSFSDEQMFAK